VYDGAGATRDVIERARSEAPLVDVRASDATLHRLWAIVDEDDLREIRRHLAPHQALIADGHHRYETYLQLQRRHRSIADGNGPWDRGLVLFIDQSQWALQLGAIHRSISEMTLADLTAPAGFVLSEPVETGESVASPDGPGQLVITDGHRKVLVSLAAERD